MKTLRFLPTLLLLSSASFSQIGKDGDVVITNTQVVNEYTWLQSDATAGDFSIDINNSGASTIGTLWGPLAAGDLVMIIQMQGATILGGVNNITWGDIVSYNNCGLYEFKEVQDVPNGTTIEFTCPIENSYSASGHVQVIRVPRFNTLTVDGGTITSLPWNGSRGGIVAIEVNGLTTLINGGEIDVTGQGFRGGIMDNVTNYGFMNFSSNSQNDGGEKGESIAGFGPEYAPLGGRYGRGAPANGGGGGNAHNAGGGGGANAGGEFPWNGLGNPDNSVPAWTTAWNLEGGGFSANQSSGGGRGGYTYSSSNQNAITTPPGHTAWGGDQRRNTGGVGGRPLDYSSGRLFVGGGGGAGDGNNGAGTNGASGGGLVYLLTYDDVVGTGQIIASGQSAPTTPPNGNDAPGGGGGGGTIVISSMGTIASTLTLISTGGEGGDQFITTNEAEGPGGGGGGGYVAFTAGTPVTNVSGGGNGTTNSLGVLEFAPNGATSGGAGLVATPITGPFNMTLAVLDDSVCIGSGTTLTAAAQDPAYNNNIQWFDAPYGGTLLATGTSFTTPALFATTTYYLKVCPAFYVDSVTVTVQANPVFNVITDSTTCFGGNDGSAQAVALLPYSYLWSNSQTGPNGTGFAPGTHSVTASTNLGCATIQNFTIAQPNPMTVAFDGSPALCFNHASGTLIASAAGGTGPYNYQWVSPAVSGNTLSNVLPGNYTVNITDDNGCAVSANGSVTSPLPLVANITSLNDVNCNDGADGDVTVGVSGGTGPYNIDWLTLTGDAFFMENLAAGNYVAEVTDANACEASVVATISEPGPFSVDAVVLSQETCSNNNGSVFASVNGGIGVLDFAWTPNVSTTNMADGLSAGTVSVLVTDENGCTCTDSETIVNHATGTGSIAAISPVTCEGGSNGSVTIDMAGGTAPFSYLWSCTCPDTNAVADLVAGNYSVDIVDYYGCVESVPFTIDQLPALVLDTVAITDPLCYGDANGSAEVAANGGTAPFFFSWNTMPAQHNAVANGLPTGTYTVTVTDANNCEAALTLTINQPADMVIFPEVISNVICFGDSAGVATVDVNGGVGGYTYNWDNGSTNDTITNLVAGTYIVHVWDANNCNINTAVIIEEYKEVVAEIVADSIFCPGDLVHFYVATNGMNNLYDYNWYVNGSLQSTQNMYSIPVYSTTSIAIELAPTMNCPSILDTIIVSPIKLDPGILDVTGTSDTLCLGYSGVVEAAISDWSYITNVTWSDAAMTGTGPHVVKPSADQYYTITVQNTCGETISDSIMLNLFLPPAANIYAWGTEGCGEVHTEFGFDYQANDYSLTDVNWNLFYDSYNGPSPVVQLEHSMDLIGHLYLTFSNNCTFSYQDTVAITVWDVPQANFYYNPDPALQYEMTEFIDISHGNPVAWEWYIENQMVSTDERHFYQFNDQGNFEVTQIVTNEFGCTDTAYLLVEVIGDFTVYVPNTFTPDGDGYNNTFKPVMMNVKPDNYEFLIFNRWGEVIFKANDLDAEWDGTYGNQGLVADGVYVYQILVTDNRDERHEYKGHVTLLK